MNEIKINGQVYGIDILGKGISIPNGSDLDTYTTDGKYFISSESGAATLLNCPISTNFMLYVTTRTTGSSKTQIIVGLNGKMYVRSCNSSGVWRTWQTYATSSDITTLTDTINNKAVKLTMAEYESLKASGKINSDTIYFISDVNDLGQEVEQFNQLLNRPVNNNLLINSNFANPVNQRGITETTSLSYTIDRWKFNGTLTQQDGYMNLKPSSSSSESSFVQLVENPQYYSMKNLTASIKYRVNSSANGYVGLYIKPDWDEQRHSRVYLTIDNEWHTAQVSFPPQKITTALEIAVYSQEMYDVDIEWIKLEFGEVATPYVPRLYDEEWRLCQRYFQIVSDNLFPWAATTYDMVFHQYFNPMRVTPTVSIIESKIYLDNQVQSGFTFRYDYVENRKFLLYATKTSHGLKSKPYLGLYLNVELDAEL